MGLKPTPDEMATAMKAALAESQNEELLLVKAQLAVAHDKNAQHERTIAGLRRQLKEAEGATKFVGAFIDIVRPLIDPMVQELEGAKQ